MELKIEGVSKTYANGLHALRDLAAALLALSPAAARHAERRRA